MINTPVIKNNPQIAPGIHRTIDGEARIEVVHSNDTFVHLKMGLDSNYSVAMTGRDLREAAELFNALADVLEGGE